MATMNSFEDNLLIISEIDVSLYPKIPADNFISSGTISSF